MIQKAIFHLDGGGPLDIPAVDKGKDGDAEDGEQFDHLEIKDLVNVILISRLFNNLEIQDLDIEIFFFLQL